MSEPSTLDRLPPRVFPLLYFGFGQLCLAAAVLLKAVNDVRVVRRAFPTRGH